MLVSPPTAPLLVQTPAFLRVLLLGFLAIRRTRGRVVPSVGRGRPGLPGRPGGRRRKVGGIRSRPSRHGSEQSATIMTRKHPCGIP